MRESWIWTGMVGAVSEARFALEKPFVAGMWCIACQVPGIVFRFFLVVFPCAGKVPQRAGRVKDAKAPPDLSGGEARHCLCDPALL